MKALLYQIGLERYLAVFPTCQPDRIRARHVRAFLKDPLPAGGHPRIGEDPPARVPGGA